MARRRVFQKSPRQFGWHESRKAFVMDVQASSSGRIDDLDRVGDHVESSFILWGPSVMRHLNFSVV